MAPSNETLASITSRATGGDRGFGSRDDSWQRQSKIVCPCQRWVFPVTGQTDTVPRPPVRGMKICPRHYPVPGVSPMRVKPRPLIHLGRGFFVSASQNRSPTLGRGQASPCSYCGPRGSLGHPKGTCRLPVMSEQSEPMRIRWFHFNPLCKAP